MRVEIHPGALDDIWNGYLFYEEIKEGLGVDFYSTLMSEIQKRLPKVYAIKPLVHGRLRWMLSERFPWAVYYSFDQRSIVVHAILDCRRDPGKLRDRLEAIESAD